MWIISRFNSNQIRVPKTRERMGKKITFAWIQLTFSGAVKRMSPTYSTSPMNSHLHNMAKSVGCQRQKDLIAARLIMFKETTFVLSANYSTTMEANDNSRALSMVWKT